MGSTEAEAPLAPPATGYFVAQEFAYVTADRLAPSQAQNLALAKPRPCPG